MNEDTPKEVARLVSHPSPSPSSSHDSSPFFTHCLGPRVGVRIGDQVLDLKRCHYAGLFNLDEQLHSSKCFLQPTLNAFMGLDSGAWKRARAIITEILSSANESVQSKKKLRAALLVPVSGVSMHLPAAIGDYTDFYASMDHARNVGIMFRGAENPLLPNWKHLPVGYHGRASSVVVSGTPVQRPNGQYVVGESTEPVFGSCKMLDFELEVGCFVGGPTNPLGTPITMEEAESRLFGVVLLNDWSARDIQKWEYVPLGPFLGKNFGTSISPWVVTFDALRPFVVPGTYPHDPKPLPYLQDAKNANYDVSLRVKINGSTVCNSNMKYLYWTFKQQLVHHAVTGCNMNPGDLLGSGTISGPKPEEFGSMLELAWKGTKPVKLADGTERKFLQDNDVVTMEGFAKGPNFVIGFGECSGAVLPANQLK